MFVVIQQIYTTNDCRNTTNLQANDCCNTTNLHS